MKILKTHTKAIYFLLLVFLIVSCSSDSDKITESQIDTSTPVLSELDSYLRETFVKPYNIEILYLWDVNNTDLERFIRPVTEPNVEPLANALLKTWIEPYNTLGGADFINKITPRQFVFAGSFNFNPNSPTITLGIAEAGTRITLFNVDFLDFTDANSIKRPLKTVHHEYGHILNQTIPVDPIYGQINPAEYTAQWFNNTDAEANELGFITNYAALSENEDFVEMVAEMLTSTRDEFDAVVNGIESEEARNIIRQKERMVVDYYLKNFGIDIYELQVLTEAAIQEITN